MKPLSREASDALSALKSPEPSAADEARVRKNLERTLGLVIPVAGVAAGATAATAQAATGAGASGAAGGATALSLGAKVAGFVFAVGVGTALTVTTARSVMAPRSAEKSVVVAKPMVTSPAAPAAVAAVENPPVVGAAVAQPEPEVEVSVEEQPVVTAEAPVVQASKPAIRTRAVVEAPVVAAVASSGPAVTEEPSEEEESELPPPPPPPNTQESYDLQIETDFPNCDPATEMRSALNARRMLVAKRAEEAVGLLEAYQRRCPSGRWSNEAWTVRLGGLCMLGRNAEARGFLEWFSTESPERRAAVIGDLHRWCSVELLKQ